MFSDCDESSKSAHPVEESSNLSRRYEVHETRAGSGRARPSDGPHDIKGIIFVGEEAAFPRVPPAGRQTPVVVPLTIILQISINP